MSVTQHLTFVRKLGDKTVLITVVDSEQVKDLPNESFVMSTTQSSIYTNMNPCITLNKSETFQNTEVTQGNSISGILTAPVWFVRTVRDALMGGLIREEKDTNVDEKDTDS